MPIASHTSLSPGPAFSSAISGVKNPAVPHDAELQPVDKTRTSFLINSSARNLCTPVEGNLGLSHPASPTAPLILPAIIASFNGLNDALHFPPCMYSIYSCEKPAITGYFFVIWLPLFFLFGKLSIAILTIPLAMSFALCSSKGTCCAPGILTLSDVVKTLVWNFLESSVMAGIMHCTSTTIASTSPVIMPSS